MIDFDATITMKDIVGFTVGFLMMYTAAIGGWFHLKNKAQKSEDKIDILIAKVEKIQDRQFEIVKRNVEQD